MSGFELPGFVVGVVPLVLKSVIIAWKVLDDTISFSDDTEDLIIRLETVKAQLGIWAKRSGLTGGELLDSLVPLEELIARTLKRICDLITRVEQQGSQYGLLVVDNGEKMKRDTTAAVIQMRRSLRSIISNSRSNQTNLTARLEVEATQQARPKRNADPGVPKRVLWAIRDRAKFKEFIDILEKHINGLRDFVIESERKSVQQEGTRLALEIIRGLSEQHALSQLVVAPNWDGDFSQMDVGMLAKWKAITMGSTTSPVKPNENEADWSLASIASGDRVKSRFIKRGRTNLDAAYLFERKEYDPNISDELKDQLLDRIRQLLALLTDPKSQRHLHTLQALDYLDDVDHHCWWIVFRFPLGPLDTLGDSSHQPLSLRLLFSAPYKPPLEVRYRLAKRLVDTFARLCGSNWMHKGITSKNIIFPHIHSPDIPILNFKSINAGLIQGFNYSRQLTQAQTIDRGKVLNDLEAAIYRHPLYQGDAASGYQVHYDIYSLGLVLFEIALWGPLVDMLAAKFRPGKEPPVALLPDMRHFHEVEARELKRRVDIRVEHELAYRVGTKYKEVVGWCLNLKEPVNAVEFYDAVAMPLDEICGC
ncbi:hypothetical protein BDW02DRAFT_574900 [Decorospora gaudefroyi]|uniref:Protein kinase domain-containing protein n=1 Tax=Decorospora gaudefroyi TaxID=184978 RepID=A0A6A5JY89_9PLEO|nr:hypothetical protein BDW02DRAFT_574900 [Decorospora gaudefroyi]